MAECKYCERGPENTHFIIDKDRHGLVKTVLDCFICKDCFIAYAYTDLGTKTFITNAKIRAIKYCPMCGRELSKNTGAQNG